MKRINYFVAMAAALAIGFTSCSKDSDPAPAEDIAKEYKGDVLVVTNAGETVPDGTMIITAVDATNATLTLSSIVNGQSSIDIPATVVQATTGYAFEGKKDIDGMKVTVKGTVVDGKAAADVAVEIIAKDILGSWRFTSSMAGEESPISFAIKNKTGKLIFFSEEGKEIEMDTDGPMGFNSSIEMMGGLGLTLAMTDFAFNFQSNGYVGISGKVGMPEKKEINMPKLARYYYNPTAKMLIFDAPIGGLLSKADASLSLSGTMQVPFQCTFEDGKILAVLEPSFANKLISLIPAGSVDVILGMLGNAIPTEGLFVSKEYIVGLVKTILVAITDKENFESLTLGGRLASVEAEK